MRDRLERVIGDVRAAVEDWSKMRARALDIACHLSDHAAPAGIDAQEEIEAGEFLSWLEDENFAFLGYREYEFVDEDGQMMLASLPDTGLGILRQPPGARTARRFDRLPRRCATGRSSPTCST